jgi:hypothetical protein
MKVKKQNIIKNFTESTAVKRIFLQIFINHLLLAHVVLQSYVLCFESNGRIVLENAADKQHCCNSTVLLENNFELTETNVDEDCQFCEDISITENCDDEYSITVKKLQPVIQIVLHIFDNSYVINEKLNFLSFAENTDFRSLQLDSYKTVLLLI